MRLSFLFLPFVHSLSHDPKQGASLRKDCVTVSDEQREQQLRVIAEQISRAAAEDDNPIKRPSNVFKSSAHTTSESSVNEKKRPPPMNAAERLIVEGAVLNS